MNLLSSSISVPSFFGHSTSISSELELEAFRLDRKLESEVNSTATLTEELFILLVSLLQLKAIKGDKITTNYINQAGAVLAFSMPGNAGLEYRVNTLLLRNELLA